MKDCAGLIQYSPAGTDLHVFVASLGDRDLELEACASPIAM
jgi:hypothetical protein